MSFQDDVSEFFEAYHRKFVDGSNPNSPNHKSFLYFVSANVEDYCQDDPKDRLDFLQQIYYHRRVIESREMIIRGICFDHRGTVAAFNLESMKEDAKNADSDELEKYLTHEERRSSIYNRYLVSCKENYRSSAYNWLMEIMVNNKMTEVSEIMDFEEFQEMLSNMSNYYADQFVNYKPIRNVLDMFFDKFC